MSDLIFPTLRGLTYPITKTPQHNTITQRSMSGIPKFFQQYTYPYYTLKLQFDYLSDNSNPLDDVHTLMGFYNSVGGAGQDFLFADPLFENNVATNQLFAVGDGVTSSFQLAKSYGGFVEPVFGLIMTPIITINGVATTAFTWNTHALITFATPPPLNAQIAWSGDWYYRCHFLTDKNDFDQIFCDAWELQDLQLETVKI